MKKIFVVLIIVAFAAPTWAAVTVNCAQGTTGADCNKITVSYVYDQNEVRAFALDFEAVGGTISGLGTFKTGESTSASRGYGIFPGKIVISGSSVSDYNTPVGDPCDDSLGTEPGLGYGSMTIEMGSLYVDDTNKPATSGDLLEFYVSASTTAINVTENSARGGVVMKRPAEAVTPTLNGIASVVIPCVTVTPTPTPTPTECFPTGHPDYANWAEVGKPPCWCEPRQCHGDASGTSHDDGIAANKQKWVGDNDWPFLVAGWQQKRVDLTALPKTGYDNLFMYAICADFSHTSHDDGIAANKQKWIGDNDWPILVSNWQVKAVDCGPDGTDTCSPDCLDF